MKKLAIGILIPIVFCFCLGCENSTSQKNSPSDTHLRNSLSNLFTVEWFDEISRFQDMIGEIESAQKKGGISGDYLRGYLDCDVVVKERYIYIIYSSQAQLKDPVLPLELNQTFADFNNAKIKFQKNLKDALVKTKKVPTDDVFKTNLSEMKKLSDDLFVNTNQLRGVNIPKFQKTLQNITACLNASFPEPTSK